METIYQSLVAVEPLTLIANICNLFIQMLIIKKFFLDKIVAVLDQRRSAADKEITDAEKAKQEALALDCRKRQAAVGSPSVRQTTDLIDEAGSLQDGRIADARLRRNEHEIRQKSTHRPIVVTAAADRSAQSCRPQDDVHSEHLRPL